MSTDLPQHTRRGRKPRPRSNGRRSSPIVRRRPRGRSASPTRAAPSSEIAVAPPATPDLATLPVSTEVVDRNGLLLRPFTTRWSLAPAGDTGQGRSAFYRRRSQADPRRRAERRNPGRSTTPDPDSAAARTHSPARRSALRSPRSQAGSSTCPAGDSAAARIRNPGGVADPRPRRSIHRARSAEPSFSASSATTHASPQTMSWIARRHL